MKISYKPVGTGAWKTLADTDLGATIEREAYPCHSHNQVEPLASGGGPGSPFLKSLGNTTCGFQWRGNVVYASAAAALTAILALKADLTGVDNHLKVTDGGTDLYLPNAVLDVFEAERQNKCVNYTLNFTAKDITGTVQT